MSERHTRTAGSQPSLAGSSASVPAQRDPARPYQSRPGLTEHDLPLPACGHAVVDYDCTPCQQRYQARYHQETKAQRNPIIQQRNAQTVAQIRTEVQQLLSLIGCQAVDCAAPAGAIGVRGRYDKGRRFSDLIRAGWSTRKLTPLIEQAQAAGDVLCAGCLSRLDAAARRAARGDRSDSGTDRTCSGCDKVKPEGEFSWRNKSAGVRQRRCKPCASAASQASAAARQQRT